MFRIVLAGLIPLVGSLSAAEGVVEGTVVNASRSQQPAAGIEVVLRAPFNGEFVVVAQTTSDAEGRFRFDGLPLDHPGPFLPGANLGEIHFPGPRIRLDAADRHANVTLAVFESSADPNPLLIEQHRIDVSAEPGLLRVRERMLISNPSTECFVGSPRHEGGGPVTLRLGIPSDFQRVTFDREGFGRQFHVINEQLVTGIPWPPGKRELAFSYVIANEDPNRVWQRVVDLPTESIEIRVRANDVAPVASNLQKLATANAGEVCFTSGDQRLPAGMLLNVQLDRLSVPLMVYARRAALLILVVLVGAVSLVSFRRGAPAGRSAGER